MERRRGFDLAGDVVCRAVLVVVPVNMHHGTVTVRVRVTGEDDDATQRGIERIIAHGVVMVMVSIIMAVCVFLEAGFVSVLVLAVSECNGDFEAMRLRYLVQRFPVASPVGKDERLARIALAQGFRAQLIDGRAGEAEAGRNTIIEDRQLGRAPPGVDPLQFRPVYVPESRRVVVTVMFPVVMVGTEQATMAVTMAVAAPQLVPCRDTDPATEGDESDAGGGIDGVTEARGKSDTSRPDHKPDDKSGDDMAGPGLQGGASSLGLRPAALPGKQSDRNPMVGNNRMKHPNDGDAENEQKAGSVIHAVAPGCHP
jgi:hypothetical protein